MPGRHAITIYIYIYIYIYILHWVSQPNESLIFNKNNFCQLHITIWRIIRKIESVSKKIMHAEAVNCFNKICISEGRLLNYNNMNTYIYLIIFLSENKKMSLWKRMQWVSSYLFPHFSYKRGIGWRYANKDSFFRPYSGR
jgi:hypothetical protein